MHERAYINNNYDIKDFSYGFFYRIIQIVPTYRSAFHERVNAMELIQLEMFSHLAKYENMSVTAQIMNTSQPSISRMLASLESELGVRLFDRVGRNITLNEQGKAFLRHAETALTAVSDGRRTLAKVKNELLGEINIGTFSFASILNAVASAFREENPFTLFRFISGNSGYGGANILLTSMLNDHYVSEAQFPVCRQLFTENYYLVFSAGHYPEFNGRTEISLSEMIDYPLILMGAGDHYVNSDNALRETLMHMLNRPPRVAFESNDYTQKMLLVLNGAGLSLLPFSCLESARHIVPDLQIVEFTDFAYERAIAVARKPRQLLSEAENAFWDYMLSYYDLEPDLTD